jgi:hypothetical protein
VLLLVLVLGMEATGNRTDGDMVFALVLASVGETGEVVFVSLLVPEDDGDGDTIGVAPA